MARKKKTIKKVSKNHDINKQQRILRNLISSIVVILILLLAFFKLGLVGIFIHNLLRYLSGEFYYVNLVSILILFAFNLVHSSYQVQKKHVVALILFNLAVILLETNLQANSKGFVFFNEFIGQSSLYFRDLSLYSYGGIIGAGLFAISSVAFDILGTYFLIVVLFLIALILIIPYSTLDKIQKKIKENKIRKHEVKVAKEKAKVENSIIQNTSADNLITKANQESKLKRVFNIIVDNDNQSIASKDDENFNTKTKPSLDKVVEKEPDITDLTEKKIKSNFAPTVLTDEQSVNTGEDLTLSNNKQERIIGQEKSEEKVVTSVVTNENQPYRLPPFSLLSPVLVDDTKAKNQAQMDIQGQKIIDILNNFGISSELIAVHIGPSVTKFEIKPASSVKVSKISNLSDNIKMELAARDIRIEAPIPGKSAVGIEVPNVAVSMVKMLEVIRNLPVDKKEKKLLFVLGKDLMGNSIFCELNKMPHLLIAGATGSGKSVCINTIITSFLLRTSPDEVKMLLIDPKKVEFMPYKNIPHLIGPVVSDPNEASNALKVVVLKMEERFDLFSKVGVRNIESYNNKVKDQSVDAEDKLEFMPYIVVIIDELADLMMVAGKDVEASIQRITQLARASGIHLIVATQRPSTDVITGIIKSNIPSRISFSVASGIDSRTILDQVGAERLLGNGDMLYAPSNLPSSIRIQGVYVSDEEVKSICDYVSSQAKPKYEDAFIRLDDLNNGTNNSGLSETSADPLYQEAIKFVISSQKASTSLLQRNFGIGYNRAARLIDALESERIIGPINGSKPREVYVKENDDNESSY